MTKRKPPELLQKGGRKAKPPEEQRHWTVLELYARMFVTVTDCWEWRGLYLRVPKSENGRTAPVVHHAGKRVLVRHLAWELMRGTKLADGLRLVPAKCSNPRCMNPKHQQALTESQKQKRAAARGSFTSLRRRMAAAATRRRSSSITIEVARQIRATSGPGTKMSQQFGISPRSFNNIRSGRTWREYG